MSLVGTTVGHVRVEALLGEGGMGAVYRGFDQALERPVAVKTLRADRRLGQEGRARFLREARLLSRLDHPSICRVFDLVERPEADCLVLELVEGQTLAATLRDAPPTATVLGLFERVAEGLAAAHRERIVHRDLKPQNVMVTPQGEVKILDFGIARSLAGGLVRARPRTPPPPPTWPAAGDGTDLDRDATRATSDAPEPEADLGAPAFAADLSTREGAVLGTVRYMSPEQAAGEEVTEASDLYSLGVMLHEALAGSSPYGACEGVDLLLKVYRAEVQPLVGADPELAALVRDLESIDPGSRPTAAATAERLRAIRERPQRRRRRRLRLAAATAVAAVVVSALGVAAVTRLEAGRRTAVAQRFAQEAEAMAWLMRAEHLSPPHDIRPAKARVRRQMERLEARMAELGAVARGPGEYALGRGFMALGDHERARDHLERAWAAGHRQPGVAYALGLTYGELYRAARQRVALASPELRREELARVERELKAPALRFLAAAGERDDLPAGLLQGLIAFHEGRQDDALRLAAELDREAAWLYEVDLLAADVHAEVARQEITTALAYAAADQSLGQARAALGRAAERGRSDPQVLLRQCEVEVRQVENRAFGERRPPDPDRIAEALARCEQALTVDPDLAPAHAAVSTLLVAVAMVQQGASQDPWPSLERAVERADRAVALDPANPDARFSAAWARKWLGLLHLQRGTDPRPDLDQAIAQLSWYLERRPGIRGAQANLGDCCTLRAYYEQATGGDPGPWLERGIAVLEDAIANGPEAPSLSLAAGHLYLSRGRHLESRGGDGVPDLELAAGHYRRAAEASNGPAEWGNLALARVDLGNALLARGNDPAAAFAAAHEAADRATSVNPRFGQPFLLDGLAHLGEARLAARRGGDPGEHLEAARRRYREGLALAPDNVEAYPEQASIELEAARLALRQGRSPAAALAAARSALDRGLRLNPRLAAAFLGRGEVELEEARWRLRQGRSPADAFDRATAALAAASQLNPRDAQSERALAELHLERAGWLERQRQAAAADVDAGLAAATRALERNPRLAEAELARARLLQLAGHEGADAALERVRALDPLLADLAARPAPGPGRAP